MKMGDVMTGDKSAAKSVEKGLLGNAPGSADDESPATSTPQKQRGTMQNWSRWRDYAVIVGMSLIGMLVALGVVRVAIHDPSAPINTAGRSDAFIRSVARDTETAQIQVETLKRRIEQSKEQLQEVERAALAQKEARKLQAESDLAKADKTMTGDTSEETILEEQLLTANRRITELEGRLIEVSGRLDSLERSDRARIGADKHAEPGRTTSGPAPSPAVNPHQGGGSVSAGPTDSGVGRGATLQYQVVAGDSLSTIAEKFCTSMEALKKLNSSVTNLDKLAVGQSLQYPVPPDSCTNREKARATPSNQ